MIEKNIDTYETEREIDWTTDKIDYGLDENERGPRKRKINK
jgi:hypothetical protein